MQKHSPNGERYLNDESNRMMENGHYVKINIAWQEIKNAWLLKSKIPFDSTNNKGEPIKATIFRFLTSKGLVKNDQTIQALSQEEVIAIENGITNIRFLKSRSFTTRIYESLWELHNYANNLNPSGNSLGQRLEFWKTGWEIFKDNSIIGVGTGDLQLKFNEYYEKLNTSLDEQHRYRAHNQYLTMGIAFGSFGLLVFVICLIIPLKSALNLPKVYWLSMIVMLISFLTEDTLETQDGATLFTCMYCLSLLPGKESQ